MHGFWWKVDDGTFHYAALSRRCRRSPAWKAQVDAEAMAEMVAMTAFLLDLGADIRRGGGDLALANAIKSRNAELAQFLQARGARFQALNESDQPALELAIVNGELPKAAKLVGSSIARRFMP
ncbi:hypothetical protein BO99DRAFT_403844 [Aspergillus violaceofuscus CBS 115571]|uniref:Uncharacterized protein n=1 Tax=Aspergillus violaceofuscus (strain CBS 115571) TaxID=1450538 RepID=A0A2V5H2H2_ASPV1|nr:hypothetical protein BO99DRAFT_403844 [Aspergillus violaceofuscus CBS 115571]